MNGLEAIELMKQGKMIESDSYFTRYIKDGVMYSVTPNGDVVSNDFDINYEEYRECTHKQLTGWERVNYNDNVYVVGDECNIALWTEKFASANDNNYNNANYFSTKEKAEEINFKQVLFRKLQRFSDESGGHEIDWNDPNQDKWMIRFDHKLKELCVSYNSYFKIFGQVYFISKETAEKAIELFHDELIKYFTQYK